MLVILGKTASGKTTILRELCKHGYHSLVTYTSRPRRKDEPSNTYHFISEEDFLQKAKDGFFAEWCYYETVRGKWYYGSAKDDYENADDKTVVILNPYGYQMIMNNMNIPLVSVYLYANQTTIKQRLKNRGDDPSEIERRIEKDNSDFKGLENHVSRIIYNNSDEKIKNVVKKIMNI